MQVLLRLVRRRPDGIAEEQDSDLQSDRVTIGSAADRDVQLLGTGVASDHAFIEQSGGDVTITGRRGVELIINGAKRRAASLTSDDVVEIGGHRLSVIEAPAGFDLGIRVELSTTSKAADFERAFRTDLSATWLSKRAASWILLLLVAAVGFGIPFLSTVIERSPPKPTQGRDPEPLIPAALSDAFWSTGPLAPEHAQATHNECKSCHQSFFVHAQDSACLGCHKTIRDHVDARHSKVAGLPEKQRCAQCHREHNGSHAPLTVRADKLCVNCHGSDNIHFETRSLQRVKRFDGDGAHPEFKVTLLSPAGRVDIRGATQQSNLVFSHEFHLAGEPVLHAKEQRALKCPDCHVLGADGEHFVPITMANACSSCHSLTFDEQLTRRQLPHGNAEAAVAMLQDYYVHQALDPPRAAMQVRRQLPDRPQREPCTLGALQCGLQEAAAEVELLFNGDRGCKECHQIADSHRPPDTERFTVSKVRLTTDFFPDVHFSHRAHEVQRDLTGDAACESCHAMRTSKTTDRVLIPGIAKCLECHADYVVAKHVELRCVSCHKYHPTAGSKKPEEGLQEVVQK